MLHDVVHTKCLYLSLVKDILGVACPLVLHVAEWTTAMLDVLKLVLVQQEEMGTLSTALK